MHMLHRPGLALLAAAALLWAAATTAAPVTQLSVHVAVGGEDLAAGSVLELKIYEIGGRVRRLPLAHGEVWPRNSTRVIPLVLAEPLDPRTVKRFALYYRSAVVTAAPWEVASAEVDLQGDKGATKRLLDTTLSGSIAREGELASIELEREALACVRDADCDDGRSCNGRELCRPRSPAADARGCVRGTPVVCPVNQICSEGRGCVGAEPARQPDAAASAAGP
jgi:hypothetical protein